MEKVNDKELIEAIKQGQDSKVFSKLYEHTFPKIKSFVIKGGGQEEDAQDIFQDAVMAFFRIVLKGTYQHKTEVDAYIYVVARNAWYAKNKKDVKTTTLDSVATYEYEEYGAENKIMDGEKQLALKKLLSSLGERCENLLINTIYYNMSL